MTDQTLLMSQIQKIRIFSCLNEEERHALLAISSILDFQAGETLVSQNEVGDALYCVLSGKVAVSIKDLHDKDVVISELERGEVIGEAAIFLSARRTASVSAATDTTVIRIKRENLLTFFRNYPQAGNKILTLIILSLLKKIRNTNEDLVLEKQSEIDFDYVDALVQDFINEDDND